MRLMLTILLPAALCATAAAFADDAPAAEEEAGFVVVCHIEGMIDEGIAVVVERAVAEARDARGLVFIVDTFGGRVDAAVRITQAILDADSPTVAYISGNGAISAGAIISFACDTIIMAPGTEIGASAPVTMGAESELMNEKSMSFVRAKYRSLAEVKGHPALLGEAMVDPGIEVRGAADSDGRWTFWRVEEGRTQRAEGPRQEKEERPDPVRQAIEILSDAIPVPVDGVEEEIRRIIEGARGTEPEAPAAGPAEAGEMPGDAELISAAGELLTLTADQARRLGLAAGVARNLEEVMEEMGWEDARQEHIVPTWAEALFRFLTNPLISGLLLMVGFGGIYLEVRTPGFGLPGILGVSALALFFGAQYIVGMADWLDLVLVMLGISLIIVELFLLPGFGVIGLAGIVSLLAGIYLSLTRVPIPEYTWDYEILANAGTTLATFVISFSSLVVFSAFAAPKSPLFRRLILAGNLENEAGWIVQDDEDESRNIGLRGVTSSVLRPAGRGRFSGKNYDIMTRGEYIEQGVPVEIIQVEGNRYVVRAIKEATVNKEEAEGG